jgi:hypothetical protein
VSSQRLHRPAVRSYLVTMATPPDGTVCQPERHPFDPDFG